MKNLLSILFGLGMIFVLSSVIAFAQTYPSIAFIIFISILVILFALYLICKISDHRNKNASSEKEFAKLRKDLGIEAPELIKETLNPTPNPEKRNSAPIENKTIERESDSKNITILEKASRDLGIPISELKEYDRIYNKYKLDYEIYGNAARLSEQPRNMWNYDCYLNYLTEQKINESIDSIYNLDIDESERKKKHEEIERRERLEKEKKIQIEKKHIIISLLLDPANCHFEAKDLINEGETPFGFLNKGLRMRSKEDMIYGSIFVWILKQTEDREGFLNMMEILDKNNIDLWRHCIGCPPEEIIEEIKRYFPEFKLANDPEEAKAILQWALLDTYALLGFIVKASVFILKNFYNDICYTTLSGCTSLEDLYILALNDLKEGNIGLNYNNK